jgi:hypothetical protein
MSRCNYAILRSSNLMFMGSPTAGFGTKSGQSVVLSDTAKANSLYQAVTDDTVAQYLAPAQSTSRPPPPRPPTSRVRRAPCRATTSGRGDPRPPARRGHRQHVRRPAMSGSPTVTGLCEAVRHIGIHANELAHALQQQSAALRGGASSVGALMSAHRAVDQLAARDCAIALDAAARACASASMLLAHSARVANDYAAKHCGAMAAVISAVRRRTASASTHSWQSAA